MFGWKPDDCLSMPAVRFFAITNSGRIVKERQRNVGLLDLASVAAIPMTPGSDYLKELRTSIFNRIYPPKPEPKASALSGEMARAAIFSACASMRT